MPENISGSFLNTVYNSNRSAIYPTSPCDSILCW